MAKRATESELRFLKDNVQKMSVQALADVLSVRIDELERKMEKLGLLGGTQARAAEKAQRWKALRRHTADARGQAAAHVKETLSPHRERSEGLRPGRGGPPEKEVRGSREELHGFDSEVPGRKGARRSFARVPSGLRAVPESRAPRHDRARRVLLRGGGREAPGKRLRGDRALEARGEKEWRRTGRLSSRLLLRPDGRLGGLAPAPEESDRRGSAPPHPGAPRPRFRSAPRDAGVPGAPRLVSGDARAGKAGVP